MATLTQEDNRAKFLELRGQGVSVADARNKTYGPPPVVADQTPAVPVTTPVSPTLSINQKQRADNIASRQANPIVPAPTPAPVAPVAPVTPAPMVQAPVDPTTGLSKPLEQAAQPSPIQSEQDINKQYGGVIQQNGINSVQPKVQKPVTPVKIEPVIDRQKQIETNLATGYNANPSLFNDRTAFEQAYNYQTKSPEERATLDSFYSSKQPTISSMYSAILNKQEVPEQTKLTPAYKIAQNRYTKANMYSGMTATQVSSEMGNAKLIEGSQAFEDLKAINPKLVQDATNLRKVNGDKTNIWTNNPDGTKVNNLENTFASDFNDNFGDFIKSMYKIQTPEEIRAIIYTPDVKASEDKAKSIELDINKIDDSLAQIDRDVEKELAGSGATGSRIAMEKASRRDILNNQRASLERNYTTYANKANNLITQNTTVFQTQQTQKQAQNAAMMPFITDKYKTAQAKQQAEAALNDPATQIQSTMKEFADMGIVAQGTTASKIAEFKTSGKTLPEYISGLRAQFMSKPEYKKIQEIKSGQLSDAQKFSMQNAVVDRRDTRNFSQQVALAKMNGDIARQKFLFEIENDPEKQAKALALQTSLASNKSLFDVLGKNVGTYAGNRGYDLAGALGDPLPAGGNWTVKSVGEAGEQVGSIFIGGKGSKPWGNTVVMTDESGNEIRYSHLQNIGVKQGDVLGFGDIVGTRGNTGNVVGANGEKLTADQLKAGRGAHIDVEIKSGGKLLSNADQVTFLKGLTGGSMGGTPIGKLGEYIVDTQPRGQGFSDADAKAFTQSVQKYVNAGDTATVYQLLRNKILENKNVGPDIYDNAELKTGLDNMKSLLTSYKESGGNTSILSSIAETVANKIGTTTDIQLAKAKNQLGVLVADYIRAISGTAASDTEVQRLIGNMPQMKNIDSFNIGLIDNLHNIADRRIQAKLNVYLGNKKDQAQNLFPEFYSTTQSGKQSGSTQPTQVSENDKSAYDAYLKSKGL